MIKLQVGGKQLRGAFRQPAVYSKFCVGISTVKRVLS